LQNKSGAQVVAPRFFLPLGNLGQQYPIERKWAESPRPENHIHELVSIVVVVIPIAFRVPAVAVFVPPTMVLVPAVFPRVTQLMARTIRLLALPSVMLHGFMQFVVRLGDAALATVVVIRKRTRRSREG
jgi:hypothetical protein